MIQAQAEGVPAQIRRGHAGGRSRLETAMPEAGAE
jgi:hypothetical protein